ncbi:MAG TPA: heme exporter protein CcmB [Candidatus Limnocylindria bacterium]|jgi:heme exporter protein B
MRGLTRHLAVAGAIAGKDLRAELRGRQAVTSTLFLAAVTMLVFGFALGPDRDRLAEAGPGLLWLAVVLSGILALGRLHHLETEDGAFELLGLYPVSRAAIYLGKALGGLAAMLALGAIVVPLSLVLFGVDVVAVAPGLLLVIGLGSVGLAAVGTLYAGLTVRLRSREVLLPLLLLPVVAPLLLASVSATAVLLAGDPFGELAAWLQLLAGYDVAMLLAGGLTYGLALEE